MNVNTSTIVLLVTLLFNIGFAVAGVTAEVQCTIKEVSEQTAAAVLAL